MPLHPELAEALGAFQRGDLERARTLAERRAAEDGATPQLEHLLGLILCRSGDPAGGVEHLRRAAEASPGNIDFRVMLARALVDTGRPAEALAVAGPPQGTARADLPLWHARAEAAQAAADHGAAAEAWMVMCAARPNDWRAWANYGEALAGLERWSDAVEALGRALAVNPAERSIRENLATALARVGLLDESAEQLRVLLETEPGDINLRLRLARLLADLGRHVEAMAELDRAAQIAVGELASGREDDGLIRVALSGERIGDRPVTPADRDSVRELALLLERTNRLDALRNLLDDAEKIGIARGDLGYPAAAVALRDGDGEEAKRLLELEDSAADPVRWHRLMAKILDSIGDTQGAFAAAATMNRSVHDFDGWVARGAEYRRHVDQFAQAITPQWAARLKPLEGGPRPAPVFLVGFPRSGTTLLDTFLMGHPDAEVLEEFHMIGAAEKVLGSFAELPQRSEAELLEARDAYFAELDRHLDPAFTGLVIDKLPLNMLGLPVIHCLFPDSRVIFAQRHPCDAVLSGFMQSFTLNDAMACFLSTDAAADLYDIAMRLFTRSRDLLPLAVRHIAYEELVADPETALRPLIEFLGLEWRPELLDHRSTARARGAIITPSYDQVVQPLTTAPSGRWLRYEEQLKPVLPVLLPWARELGYCD